MPKPYTFEQWATALFEDKQFVAEYDRLHGTNLSRRGAPIELMVDKASGKLEEEMRGFVRHARDLYERDFGC